MTDKITILTSKGPLLTKRWTDAGIEPYDRAKNFTVETLAVEDIEHLSRILTTKEEQPRCCVIRGVWGGVQHAETTRDLEHFSPTLHNWVCLDVDDFEPMLSDPVAEPAYSVAEFIHAKLPHEFHTAAHHWQLSSSAGAPGNEDKLKAHIWFWLDQARSGEELTIWAKTLKVPVDVTVFRTVQVHYTAAPVIDPGVSCPVTVRSGFVAGDACVALAFDDEWILAQTPGERMGRDGMIDPGSKPGLIGAFCRAYPPERVITEVLAEHFEYEGDSEVRVTWLGGGGSPGGACVTDDGMHVFNGHNTDPLSGRAANMWDLVRHYMFSHLDVGADDFTLMEMGTTPSYIAMRAWVKTLPEIQEEIVDQLDAPVPEAVDTKADDREQVVLRAIKYIISITRAGDLETAAAARLRDLDWSKGERERVAKAIQNHFKALSGATISISIVRQWITPAVTGGGFTDLSSDSRVLGTHRNLGVILERMNMVARYNVISKEDELLTHGLAVGSDNAGNASLAMILSECNAVDMKINMGAIKSFVTLLADRNPYNPALDWVESEPWDGVDRLPELCATIVSPNPYLKEIILRRWALQGIAVLHNTGTTQARGILTLSGPQNAGKSRWLQSLAPQGLVCTGHLLDVHNKDSLKIALSYWLTEFGELDGSFRRSEIAAFKAFASLETDTQRRPYAVTESIFPRRMSPAATVNETRFLQDPTGNTRFWSICVETIDSNHKVNMQQFWAQILVLWKDGEQHWMTPEEMTLLNQSNLDFTVLDPLEESLRTKLDWAMPKAEHQMRTATEILEFLGRLRPTHADLSAVGKAVRKITGPQDYRDKHGSRLLLPPLHPKIPVEFQ